MMRQNLRFQHTNMHVYKAFLTSCPQHGQHTYLDTHVQKLIETKDREKIAFELTDLQIHENNSS